MKLLRNKEPFYIQVKNELKERIIKGDYPIGSLLPPEPVLEKEFGVSKITIRKAVEQLAIEGYVEKHSGIGTTILDNRAVSKLSKGQGFSEYLLSTGYKLKKGHVTIAKVEISDEPILSKYFEGSCYCIERLYTLNDQPYIHFTHYIPEQFALPTNPEIFKDSLYEILYEKGVTFNRFQDEFGVEVPSEKIANLLKTDLEPLFHRTRFSYDMNEQLIEYSIGYYNTKIHKYVVNLNV
ncbi:GntR family transcriptional regulator [Lysinibacillus piscis]|uniref:GntR family transcriptional regulator n=1 Tax=Lysinibacillus piscis TaxID=2518931 RepID=A0ABQ5NGX3_9BACI|nr:GntR family transcriptional regulator [Lysinibacillus sp. KH24]GLC87306.1 GntR family transcriptional regulator [Lysinibacillus sp. KH24]